MVLQDPDILILDRKIQPRELRRLAQAYFHADAERLLLEGGSRQADLWGANYYPGRGEEKCLEYTALINIRPAEGNRSMEIVDEALRRKIREITFELIGRGEEA